MSKCKKVLMNPWTITIIAPIITYFLLRTLDLIAGTEILSRCLHSIVSVFVTIYNFLTTQYEWKLYQLILLFISGPVIGFFVLWIISKFEKVNEEHKPLWLNYTKDNFDNIIYKWEWCKNSDGIYIISNIYQYCSQCECRLINAKCPNCNLTFYRYMKPYNEVEALILHKVDMMREK